MKNRTSRRIAPSSAYIGSGNKTEVFSRKARKPFSYLADIYREELKNRGGNNYRMAFKHLTSEEKQEVRKQILERRKKEDLKKIILLGFLGLLLVVALYWVIN